MNVVLKLILFFCFRNWPSYPSFRFQTKKYSAVLVACPPIKYVCLYHSQTKIVATISHFSPLAKTAHDLLRPVCNTARAGAPKPPRRSLQCCPESGWEAVLIHCFTVWWRTQKHAPRQGIDITSLFCMDHKWKCYCISNYNWKRSPLSSNRKRFQNMVYVSCLGKNCCNV